ncbi:hypothetical protein Tco_1284592 [Tanacetum coccineum]
MREFVIAQKTVNDFVKNQFYNLKTKVEQGQKNHQAAIQDLEAKFGRISDHQSSRPTGMFRGYESKTILEEFTPKDKHKNQEIYPRDPATDLELKPFPKLWNMAFA